VVVYKIGLKNIEGSLLLNLYERVGLQKRLVQNKEYEKIKTAFERSYKVVTAWDGEMLIGAGRMLSDGICYASIFDVGVLPEYQKKGIGKEIRQELLNGEEDMPIHLTSTFGNEDFYKKLGFKKHKTSYSKYPFDTNYVED
jgi:GNAT superfamily N-acetyltransferase